MVDSGIEQLILSQLMLKYLLTDKEKKLLNLIINGKTNYEIADIMGYSTDMIKYLIKKLFKKFRVRNRLELIREALILFYSRKKSRNFHALLKIFHTPYLLYNFYFVNLKI